MGSWSPRLSWQPGPVGTPPGSDLQVKQQSSAHRGHTPRAPLSFLVSAHLKLCLWKTNRESPPPERSAGTSCYCSCFQGLLAGLRPQGGPRGARVRRWASSSDVQTLQSTSSGCLVPFASQPFWPTACLLVISLLTSVIIHKQAQHLREVVLL